MQRMCTSASALSILWLSAAFPGLSQSASTGGGWKGNRSAIEGTGTEGYSVGVPLSEHGIGVGSPSGFDTAVPEPKIERPPSGGVSVRELRHPPDRKAQAFAAKARKLSADGDHAHAAEALEKAVRIDPAYFEARINLGVEYAYLSRFEEGLAEFSRANQIAGPDPTALCDMAFAEIQLRRGGEALAALNASLKLDPYRPQAHYLLGALLASDPNRRAEALPHLELAARSMPAAQSLLERVRTVDGTR